MTARMRWLQSGTEASSKGCVVPSRQGARALLEKDWSQADSPARDSARREARSRKRTESNHGRQKRGDRMSALWQNGSCRFRRSRDQACEFADCLGNNPFDAHCRALPKSEIVKRWMAGDISSRHGGSGGREPAWLEIDPHDAPSLPAMAWRPIGGCRHREFKNSRPKALACRLRNSPRIRRGEKERPECVCSRTNGEKLSSDADDSF